jgi:hypothetical protein
MTERFIKSAPPARILRHVTVLLAAATTILCFAHAARAGTVSGLSITDSSVHSPAFVDDPNTGIKLETQSSASITSSNLSAAMPTFQARFAGIVSADTEKPAQTQTAQMFLTGSVSFNITAAPTEAWSINVTQTRNFALTLVADPPTNGFQSQAFVDLGSSSYTTSAGTGSLQFPAAPVEDTTGTFGNIDIPINKSASDVITGVGSTSVQLSVFEHLVANSFANINPAVTVPAPGQEASVRFGMLGTLTNVSADDYPGPGARNPALDGHFFDVKVTFTPEPGTITLAVLGFAMTACILRGRRATSNLPIHKSS